MLQVIFEKVHKDAIIPTKATPGAACWDVYSVEDTTVRFGCVTVVDLGFKVQIPPGYEIVIRPRSSYGFKYGLTVHMGTIDSDYRGLMKVAVFSMNDTHKHTAEMEIDSYEPLKYHYQDKDKEFKILKGDRIAQIALKKLEEYEFVEGVVDETQRGEGGFGSTGR